MAIPNRKWKGDDALDSSSSNSVSAGSLEDTIWTKKGTKAYQTALESVNYWKEQGLSGLIFQVSLVTLGSRKYYVHT